MGQKLAVAEHPPDPRPLLTINDTAVRLGVTPRFVRRLVAERQITFHRVGKFIRFDPTDVEALVGEGRVERLH
jgi:excisionase family DNA binding protein